MNSLRLDYLEKADQLEWLSFMWYFFSKSILYPGFLKWITDFLKYPQELSYALIQKNFTTIISSLVTTALHPNKNSTNSNKYDWKTLAEKYEPLLGIFKNAESVRHIILSLNILYHKLSSIERIELETTGLELKLNLENNQKRKIRYYLMCETKSLSCEDSSNKTLPT